ncbi:hypothetical protein D3C72_1164240 [compost metagenome]
MRERHHVAARANQALDIGFPGDLSALPHLRCSDQVGLSARHILVRASIQVELQRVVRRGGARYAHSDLVHLPAVVLVDEVQHHLIDRAVVGVSDLEGPSLDVEGTEHGSNRHVLGIPNHAQASGLVGHRGPTSASDDLQNAGRAHLLIQDKIEGQILLVAPFSPRLDAVDIDLGIAQSRAKPTAISRRLSFGKPQEPPCRVASRLRHPSRAIPYGTPSTDNCVQFVNSAVQLPRGLDPYSHAALP